MTQTGIKHVKYKLLILDVDGTLVESNENARVSHEVVKEIKKANRFIKISLCTGRTLEHIKEILKILEIKDSFHVIESGTKLVNPHGEIEYTKFLSIENIKEIFDTAGNTPSGYGFCVDGTWKKTIGEIKDGQTTIVALHSLNKNNTDKILDHVETIKNKYNFHVGSSWFARDGAIIHVTHPQASKEFGLKYIQNKLGIKHKESIGVGDMPNDLPLFKVSGLKIAMGNADASLKKAADVIAPSLKDDGVAWVVKQYVLMI